MNEINLLPQELKPDRQVLKLSAILKKISLFGTLALLIATALALGTYLLFQQRVTATKKNQERIKTQIKALEKTEQRLVLVKDRLRKISAINQQSRANDEVKTLDEVSKLFPDGVEISKFELAGDVAYIAVTSQDLSNLSTYLASVISVGSFEKINLVSLEFKPDTGYIIELGFPE